MHHSLNVSAPLYSTLSDPPHGIFDKNIRFYDPIPSPSILSWAVVSSSSSTTSLFFPKFISREIWQVEPKLREIVIAQQTFCVKIF